VRKPYPRGVPYSINYPEIPVYAFMENSARKFPNRDATIFLGARLKYAELWDQAKRLAAALQELGLKRGDRVSLLLPNVPQFPIAYNAVLAAGGVVVALNPLMPSQEIGREIEDTDTGTLIVLDRLLRKLPDDTPEHVIVAEAAAYAPGRLRLLSRFKYRDLRRPEGSLVFEELVKGPPLEELAEFDVRDDVAAILWTSGTTGQPKGVMLTHHNLVANALQSYHWLRGWGYVAKPQQAGWPIILCAMPFFHSYGMVVMNEAVQFGCTLVLIPQPEAEAIMKATQRYRVTHFPVIPRFIREILRHPDLGKYDLSSISHCATGGASIPPDDMKAFEEISGARFYQGYGLTEAGPSTHATPIEGDPRYESAGLAYPDTEARVMDLQLGEVEMPPGREGELVVRGPQVMKGYWKAPEETARVLRDGWLYTGDIAQMDEEGYVYIVGRKRDRIVAGGHTIWPMEVEEVLQSHPRVENAVAVGVPDPLRCDTDILAIITVSGEVDEGKLIKYCRERLEPIQVPTRIRVVDSLPMTVMGKVDRRAVEAEVDRWTKAVLEGKLHPSEL